MAVPGSAGLTVPLVIHRTGKAPRPARRSTTPSVDHPRRDEPGATCQVASLSVPPTPALGEAGLRSWPCPSHLAPPIRPVTVGPDEIAQPPSLRPPLRPPVSKQAPTWVERREHPLMTLTALHAQDHRATVTSTRSRMSPFSTPTVWVVGLDLDRHAHSSSGRGEGDDPGSTLWAYNGSRPCDVQRSGLRRREEDHGPTPGERDNQPGRVGARAVLELDQLAPDDHRVAADRRHFARASQNRLGLRGVGVVGVRYAPAFPYPHRQAQALGVAHGGVPVHSCLLYGHRAARDCVRHEDAVKTMTRWTSGNIGNRSSTRSCPGRSRTVWGLGPHSAEVGRTPPSCAVDPRRRGSGTPPASRRFLPWRPIPAATTPCGPASMS